MNKANNEGDYTDIQNFYRYKVCDSIVELDINPRIRRQMAGGEDTTGTSRSDVVVKSKADDKKQRWKHLFFSTIIVENRFYNLLGDYMKVKIFDFEDEKDLEEEINNFLSENTINLLDIKYQVGVSVFSEEQVFCFSAMIIYS